MVSKLLIGDFFTLDEVFNRYNRSLLFFAKKMVKDSKVAEEIVSDSFVKLWKCRENFETPENVKAFLYLVTKNACRNYLKSSYNKQQFEYEFSEDLISVEPEAYINILHAELISEIYHEVEKLPEKQRMVFKMSYLEGLTTSEICEQLQMSESAVFANRSRGLEFVRKSFRDKNMWLVLLIFDELFK